MQSFLTRLVGSVVRAVLLIPCLLIGLACATGPFIERDGSGTLEVGMTMVQARQAFGEPTRYNVEKEKYYQAAPPRKPDLISITGQHLRRMAGGLFIVAPVLDVAPHGAVSIWVYASEEARWFDLEEPDVELLFRGNKLVSWEVIEPARVVSSGYGYDPAFNAMVEKMKSDQVWSQLRDCRR